MTIISQAFQGMAILVFSVSFEHYYIRTIREWPLSIRFMRHIHRLGVAYSYGKKEILYCLLVTCLIYIFGVIFFIFSLLGFIELTEPMSTISFSDVPRFFIISLCLLCYLLAPSFFLHVTRGILQIIPSTAHDFVTYIREYVRFETGTKETQEDAEKGIRRKSADIICQEIESEKYGNRVLRVIESTVMIAFFFFLPWIFVAMGF